MTMTLLGDGREASRLAGEVSKALASDSWQSTQSTAFAIVALSHYMEKYKVSDSMAFTYTLNGKAQNVGTTHNIWTKTLLEGAAGGSAALKISNTGASALFASILTEGTAAQGSEEAYANGLSMAVSYTDLGGRAVDVSRLAQGTNFVAVVTVKNPTARGMTHIVLTEIFPSGWEILNTRYMTDKKPAAAEAVVSYQDIRDDRVYSYIDRLPSGTAVTVRINLAAVYSGKFYLPPVRCEAMYDNLMQASTAAGSVVVE